MWPYIFLFSLIGSLQACVERKAEFGKICVCNSTYCDTVTLGKVSPGTIKVFMTSNEKPGFNVREEKFLNSKTNNVTTITIDGTVKFQKILGFGGAFTDSTGHNIKRLPEAAQKKLMESYFSDEGIEYNMARVPIGGADFSPSFYSLDDHDGDDMELKYFALNEEDFNHKLPFMKQAFALRKSKPMRLFTSAWTTPAWMRYTPGYTIIKKTHYQVYADYYKKYFDEYAKRGIKFWGMTTQNEALSGLQPWGLAGVYWKPRELNIWLRDYLGPTLKNSSHNIKVLIHDDGWAILPFIAHPIVNDEKTVQYVDGIALHFYSYGESPLDILDISKPKNKEFILMNSEACYFVTRPFLGDWGRASNYVRLVIEHLQNGFHSWIDWNMALNITGGPNNKNLNADAPIVISDDTQEFYKQPYFYAFGHFSKFIPPDSVRVNSTLSDNMNLQVVAFERPDNLTSVVLHNRDKIRGTKVQISAKGKYSTVLDIPAASIQTFVY